VISQLITWAITLVVIRLLSPSDYGLLAMAAVFVAFLSMLSDLGLGQALVQSVEVTDEALRRVFAAVLVVHVTLAALLALASPLVAIIFSEPAVTPVVRVLSIQFLIAAFGIVPDALLQRRMDFRARSLIDLAAAVVGACSTLALAVMGKGVWALVAGSLVAQFMRAIGLNYAAPFPRWPEFSTRGLHTYLRFGGHMTLTSVLWFALSQGDLVIAGRWLGKEALGVYSTAMHLASLPSQRIAGLINQLAFPAFSRMQDDRQRVAANTFVGIRALALIGFPVFWGISCIAPELVAVVLGAKWREAIVPLQLVSLIMPIRLISLFVPNAIQGIGRSDVILSNTAIFTAVMLIGFLIGVRFGLLGLSLAWVIGSPLAFAINMQRSLPLLGRSLADLGAAVAPSAAAAFIMYAVITVCRGIFDIAGVPLLLSLIGVGFVTYCVAAWFLNRRGCKEVIDLLGSVFARRTFD